MATLSTQELKDQADQLQPDNNEQLINAAATRSVDKNIAESSFNKITDKDLVGLSIYQPGRSYEPGQTVVFDNGGGLSLYSSNKTTTGAFNPDDWDAVGSNGDPGEVINLDPSNQNGLLLSSSNPKLLGIQLATAALNGALSSSDWALFNGKQAALGFTPENVNQKGVAGGYAPLNGVSKIDTAFLPDSIVGSLNYKGFWNAAVNSPNISDASGAKGEYYVVTVPGSVDLGSGSISFALGDWAVHNGVVFDRLENTRTSKWGQITGVISEQSDLWEELNSKLSDAPNDGNQYARKNNGWSVVQNSGGPGGGIPTIGQSTDRGLLTWNGPGGDQVRNNNVKIDETGNMRFAPNAGIDGGETNAASSKILFGTQVAVMALLPQPQAGHISFAPTAVPKDQLLAQVDGTLVLDTDSLWFRRNGEYFDLLSGGIYSKDGALTSDRFVDGGDNELTFTNNKKLNLEGEEVTVDGTDTLIDGTIKLDLSSGIVGSEFTFLMEGGVEGGIAKFLDNKNNKGIEYAANYAANWTNDSVFDNVLVTKKYVDDNAIKQSTVSSDTEKGGLFFKDDAASSTLTISNTPI